MYEKYDSTAKLPGSDHLSTENCKMGFYGSATLGERGQLVIPAEARHEMGYDPGDKVLIVRHPGGKGLMLFKLEHAKHFLEELTRFISDSVDAAEGTESK